MPSIAAMGRASVAHRGVWVDPADLSYEEILELEDIIGSVSRGASAAQINEIPLETFGSAAGVVAAVVVVVVEGCA